MSKRDQIVLGFALACIWYAMKDAALWIDERLDALGDRVYPWFRG